MKLQPEQKIWPKKFLWGAATSAHQVEGHNHNDWTEWEKLGKVKNHERSGDACDHYNLFREDFALAKELGHNAHRLSIEWSRIEPTPGVFDTAAIDHYRQVLQELHRLGIEPLVTLHHFTNPVWVAQQGGWTNRQTVAAFGRYVSFVMRELGSLATWWITINEPTVYSSMAHIGAYWPPVRRSYAAAWVTIRNFAAAHQLAYQIIKRHYPHARVGAANNLMYFTAVRPGNILDRALWQFSHYWHNQWWLDQTYLSQDFIGLNYYFHHPLRFRWTKVVNLIAPVNIANRPRSDIGWEIHPVGLGCLLEWLQHYHRPIVITENGLADAQDHQRAAFIRDHVQEVERAISHGVDVRGYLYWSLLDNFEWREGFTPRFGLVEVDYHTQTRTVRDSAKAYRDLIRDHTK